MSVVTRQGLYGGARMPYGNFSGKSTSPEDYDADTVVTARTDKDGTTIRPGRVTVQHAGASARNADLVGPHRTTMDRYYARSPRSGRTPTASPDTRFRFKAWSARAGDTFAVREILLTLDARPRSAVRLAKDTTNRTDKDGTTLIVPTWQSLYAASSALNSALRAGGEWRDRFLSKNTMPDGKKVGYIHRFQLRTDGRAGSAGCPLDLTLTVNLTPDAVKAKVRET